MIFETSLIIVAVIVLIAFVAEYFDSALGMGYGTTLTPILLLMGFPALQIVPAVLVSELFTGLFAAFLHHRSGNVFFDFKNDKEHRIVKKLGFFGYLPTSKPAKVALILGICSVIGTIVAVIIALKLPKFYLSLYIGILVFAMGVLILLRHRKTTAFSWKKVTGLGVLASFNKGISGGGYGPVVTAGQILSGMDSKESIGITSLAEGITCFVGILAYMILKPSTDWSLAPLLAAGAMLSVPFSTYTVKKLKVRKLTLIIGITAVVLGLLTIFNLISA